MNSLSSLFSLLDSPCKLLIRPKNSNRSKVLLGQIKQISPETNCIQFFHEDKIYSIPIEEIVAVKPWNN